MKDNQVSYRDFIDQQSIHLWSLDELFSSFKEKLNSIDVTNVHELLDDDSQRLLLEVNGIINDTDNKKINVTMTQEYNIDTGSFLELSWIATYGEESSKSLEDNERMKAILFNSIEHCPRFTWFSINE